MFDFQIALEGGQKRVNLTPPVRFFDEFKDYPLWKVRGSEGTGSVYTNPYWNCNLVMLFSEVQKLERYTKYLKKFKEF